MIIGGMDTVPELGDTVITEVWGFENGSNTFMEPILSKDEYAYGIALFVVDPDSCKK